MDQVINFRASIDTFNESEFELFCTKLYETYNKRELIIKSLFYLFIEESKRNQHKIISNINKITKNIIDLRRKKILSSQSSNNNNIACTELSINDLASPLIAHTASYLTLPQQTSLIKCNRYIFSSLTSSFSRIQILNKFWLKAYKINHGPQYFPYQIQKLNRFRQLKEININPRDIHYASLPWNKLDLDILSLNNLVSHNKNTINIFKTIKLKQLSVKKAWICTAQQINLFVNLLHANANIECLSLTNIHFTTDRNHVVRAEMLKTSIVTQLKALIMEQSNSISPHTSIITLILPLIGEKLISLHLNFGSHTIQVIQPILASMSNKTFDNLQELCLNEDVNDDILFHIIKSAKKLRRFCWQISGNDDSAVDKIKEILSTIILEREEIEYLNIYSSSFNSFKILSNILITNKYNFKRNNLKIRFDKDMAVGVEELEYLKNNLLKLVNVLNESVGNDFMFKLGITLRDNKLYDAIKVVLHVMKNVYSIRATRRNKKENNEILRVKKIIICNKQNKICGYREKWLYSCECCNKQK